ncbi:hypothetical protein H4I96_04732 [Botrytis cinerea]
MTFLANVPYVKGATSRRSCSSTEHHQIRLQERESLSRHKHGCQGSPQNWDPKFGRFHSIWAGEAATEWASKYGVLPEAMDPTQLFFPYKKSALTPHALDNPRLKAERKNHQKWILSGYWPELLEEIGAYPYPLNYLPVLTNPIDPIFQLNQWQPPHTLETWPIIRMEFPPHKPFFPIEPDNTGLWTADNPAVWRRLDPILRLCTRLLHHSAATCWHSLNQLQESPMGRTIIRNEPAYGGDVKGNGAEVFCELGYSFVKGLLGAMPKILNPGIIVGAPAVTLLLSKEIPARKYGKGIFLHEAGEHFAQYEATNKLVPIVSKYYEYIHNDGFWDKVATNFGVSIIAPTPAPVVVVEPDPSRPELSSYVFNNSQRKWMYEVQAIKSNAQLLSSLTPEQRKAYDVALVQKDDELNKLRKLKYLHVRDKTAKSVNECNAALESFFTRSPGELSDSEILRLLGCFAETLKREADQETQCAIDFMAEAELETPFNVEFKQRLLDINRVARKMVGKASADCERVGVATLGPDFHELRAKFDRTLYILRAINFILVQQVKADKNETYEEVIDRVGTAMDYEGLERLQSSDAQDEIVQSASQETITAQAMNAYQKHDYVECHRLGGVLLSQFDLEGYAQGIGMVLIAMHPGEIRRRWCARQGLHVLNIMVKSNANPFLELRVEVATQVHDAIEDLAVNTGIGDTLCVLEID